jgi:hypothetical protein
MGNFKQIAQKKKNTSMAMGFQPINLNKESIPSQRGRDQKPQDDLTDEKLIYAYNDNLLVYSRGIYAFFYNILTGKQIFIFKEHDTPDYERMGVSGIGETSLPEILPKNTIIQFDISLKQCHQSDDDDFPGFYWFIVAFKDNTII